MYDVDFTNKYPFNLPVSTSSTVPIISDGPTMTYKDWGTNIITVPGMGDILFLDLADRKLQQFTEPHLPWTEHTWGGLVRYQGIEAYFRYEGQGNINATLDSMGGLELKFAQGGMIVAIPDITVS